MPVESKVAAIVKVRNREVCVYIQGFSGHHKPTTLFFLTRTSRQKPAPVAASSFASPTKPQTEEEAEVATAASPAPHEKAQKGSKTLTALVRGSTQRRTKRGACILSRCAFILIHIYPCNPIRWRRPRRWPAGASCPPPAPSSRPPVRVVLCRVCVRLDSIPVILTYIHTYIHIRMLIH